MSGKPISPPEEALDVITDALLTATRLTIDITAQSVAQVDDTITLEQFRSLVILFKRGSANLTTLADQTGVHPSAAGRMVDRLVSTGLIERLPHPTSRRELIALLTARGHKVVEQINEHRRAAVAGTLAKMPPRQREELKRALTVFTTAGNELTKTYDVET